MPRIRLRDSEGWRPPSVNGDICQVREGGKGRRRTMRECVSLGGLWKVGPWKKLPELYDPEKPLKPGLYQRGEHLSDNPPLSCPDAWKALIVPPWPVSMDDPDDILRALTAAIPAELVHAVAEGQTDPVWGRWPRWVAGLKLKLCAPYQHQVEAVSHMAAGSHVAISTGTASGKSLCYMLPILRSMKTHADTKALYIAPAKALCDDQLTSWARLVDGDGDLTLGSDVAEFHREVAGRRLSVIRYDADTKDSVRDIRHEANVVLTNSSMLHWILARWRDWAELFRGLRYVVLDEVHEANGIKGAHLAWLVRRLRRIAHYSNPNGPPLQFVVCSATIGNPGELSRQIIGDGRDVKVVDKDTSGHAVKLHVSWTPPMVADGSRRGTVALDLVKELLTRGPYQTIVFHRSRPEANLTAHYQSEQLNKQGRPDLVRALDVFIAGRTPAARRAILDDLREGSCLGVFATSALELGIDIGDLSAAVIVGVPHSRAGYRQMAGRVGRKQPAIAIFVPRDNPLDNWFAAEQNFGSELACPKVYEPVITDPDNDVVAMQHLAWAVKEHDLDVRNDEPFFGPRLRERMERLKQAGEIEEKKQGLFYWASADDPKVKINVLAARGTHTVQIKHVWNNGRDSEIIGQVDNWTALWMLFPGAIYPDGIQHTYVVKTLDLGPTNQDSDDAEVERIAVVGKATADEAKHYTVGVTSKDMRIVAPGSVVRRSVGGLEVCRGSVELTSSLGEFYWRVRRADRTSTKESERRKKLPMRGAPTATDARGQKIKFQSLNMQTEALWFAIPSHVWAPICERAESLPVGRKPGDESPEARALSALHGAEHLICKFTGVVPGLWADDIAGLSIGKHDAFAGGPGIFLHENVPGGTGLIDRLMDGENLRKVIQAALQQIDPDCPNKCPDGCPMCVLDRLCGNENFYLDKEGSRLLLKGLAAEVR